MVSQKSSACFRLKCWEILLYFSNQIFSPKTSNKLILKKINKLVILYRHMLDSHPIETAACCSNRLESCSNSLGFGMRKRRRNAIEKNLIYCKLCLGSNCPCFFFIFEREKKSKTKRGRQKKLCWMIRNAEQCPHSDKYSWAKRVTISVLIPVEFFKNNISTIYRLWKFGYY